jgi:hypothetical protein
VRNPLFQIDPFGLWEEIFRGMIENNGQPQIGNTARELGTRPIDIPVDGRGMVHPGTGGMSVSPSPQDLPSHRRPPGFGGTGKDPVWKMSTKNLGPDLKLVPDSPGHGTIQPSRTMSNQNYQRALAGTQDKWEMVKCR